MFKGLIFFLFLLSSLFFPLFALTLSVNVAKENGKDFSTVHLKEDLEFKCLSKIDEFDELKEVQCIFPREPKQKFEALKTNFFKIDSFTKNKKYYIRIVPIHKMKLFPMAYSLYKKENINHIDSTKASKHWSIVAYKEEFPFIKVDKTPPLGINFPIEMSELSLPSVGALDMSGKPIRMEKLKDVSAYMHIKSAYEAGSYTNLAEDVNQVFKSYPNTIFKPELLLYKIRGLHQTGESEELLIDAKEFLWEYSSDDNVPEVLAYMANAYSSVGLQADSTYFFERLFKEFPESKYAALGMVFLGDRHIASGKSKEASSYYEKALYLTKDVEIASMAAIRLAKMKLEKGDVEKASKLFEKIVEGNSKYLLYDISGNYDIARAFANRKHEKTAVDILKAILSHLPKNDDRYEVMLKDIAMFLAETDDKPAAYKALKKYQSMYKSGGDFAVEVQETLDSLFYVSEDTNKTALLAEYEDLEEKYKNQEIGQKAAIEKAKIYFEQKQYQKVLDLDGSGIEKEDIYETLKYDSAMSLAVDTLEKNQCAKAIFLSKEYNLSIESSFDEKVYECSFKTGNYAMAQEISEKHLKDKDRLKWLYNYAKTLNKLGKYEKLTQVGADVVSLSDIEKTSKYDDILKDMFYAYSRLGKSTEMIKTIKELEKRKGLKYDDIELYVSMIKLGLKIKDDLIVQNYASKVMSLQKKSSSYTQSPFVEFAMLQILKEQKKDKEQMQILTDLVKIDMSNKEKARVQYMLGSLLMKDNKITKAKKAFEDSIKADEKSAWASLSVDALDLLKK